MPHERADESRITGDSGLGHPPREWPTFPGPGPVGRGTDYSQLPAYPDTGPELPARGKADVLWDWASAFAGGLIGAGVCGSVALVCGIIVSVKLLLQGTDPVEVLRAVAVVTLGGVVVGGAFGLWIDLRRALRSHMDGD